MLDMILKLMGLVKKSDYDYIMKCYLTADEMYGRQVKQNLLLSEAYEDLRRDRDRLAKKLKVGK
jgi:hypothetical protein